MAYSKKSRRFEWTLLLIFIVICIIAALYIYRPQEGNTIAVISVDGVELQQIELQNTENNIFSIESQTGKAVSFEIKNHSIRFINVNCPDHLCEKAGWCTNPGQRAVCMPNRTTLICYDKNEVN